MYLSRHTHNYTGAHTHAHSYMMKLLYYYWVISSIINHSPPSAGKQREQCPVPGHRGPPNSGCWMQLFLPKLLRWEILIYS